MTVKELIQRLQQYPEWLPVCIPDKLGEGIELVDETITDHVPAYELYFGTAPVPRHELLYCVIIR